MLKLRRGERRIIMKRFMKRATAFVLVAAMAFSIGVVPTAAASKSAPKIKKVEYEGNGVVEVDFRGKVKYGRYNVTVKDLKGRSYRVTILERDSDDIKFRINNYRKNHTYKFNITKIKNWRGGRYYTLSGKIAIEVNGKAGRISLERAKQIATGNVGLKPNQVRFIKAKLDYDDGRYVYEVEFKRGLYEYDFEILASSGKIISRDIDYDD